MPPKGSPSKLSIYNRAVLEKSAICGCFYCLKTYRWTEIKSWTDERQDDSGERVAGSGQTALCPHCGIDSVVGFDEVTNEIVKTLEWWNHLQFDGCSLDNERNKK